MGPLAGLYQAGNKAGAIDAFERAVIGPDYRASLDKVIPGGFDQAVADADTFFTQELPALMEWRFTREDALRITQPVLAVLGADSASLWPGFKEGYDPSTRMAPAGRGFRLGGSNARLADAEPARCGGGLGGVLRTAPILCMTTSVRTATTPSQVFYVLIPTGNSSSIGGLLCARCLEY